MNASARRTQPNVPLTSNVTRALLVCAVASAALVSACVDRTQTQGTGCSTDGDCGNPASAHRCEVQTGICYCRTNDACSSNEFCNTAGFCQDRSGCERNEDCIGADLFCDTSTGTCLTRGRCSTDLHCPLGQVCDSARTTCVDGCRRDGDCAGVSCRCGDQPCACTGTTQAELQACEIGVCDPTFCSNDSFCQYGEICGQPPDAGTDRNQCYTDYDPKRRPYCDSCPFGGGVSVCGSGPNYCLIDTAHPGNYFCGADCSEGQLCPRGYQCSDVIVVGLPGTASCTRSNPACPANPSLPCTEDTDCKRGGVCVKQPGQATGSCAGRCGVDEGDEQGFCSCQVDSDCAQESCSAGECSISRRPCVTAQDCRAIRCVDFNGSGGCLIGQNCAPEEGLSCLEVQ